MLLSYKIHCLAVYHIDRCSLQILRFEKNECNLLKEYSHLNKKKVKTGAYDNLAQNPFSKVCVNANKVYSSARVLRINLGYRGYHTTKLSFINCKLN